MSKIFIYGAPGVGKTTFGEQLKIKNDFPLIEADYLREVIAQREKTPEEDPFVYVGTKEAWREYGDLDEENVIRGLMSVRNSMKPYVDKEILKHNDLILEGAFLIPHEMIKLGETILVMVNDEHKHQQQFFAHREKTDENVKSFKAVRIIQNYLIKEAEKLSVEIVDNS